MTDAEGLEAALDRLYQCVLTADFGDLPKILAETERISLRLLPLTDANFGQRLRGKAIRNGHCLRAAAKGVRAAQRRLADISAASGQLSTYTRDGHLTNVDTGTGVVAKRL